MTTVHYLVSVLDEYGDIIDVHHCLDIDEARELAADVGGTEIDRVTVVMRGGREIRRTFKAIR